MKIEKIEVIHIRMPLKKPYTLSKTFGTLRNTEPVVVKLFTDGGAIGVGETNPMPPFTEEDSETVKMLIKRYLGPAIIASDPVKIAKIHQMMDSILKGNYLAKAAIDMACYDLIGKAANLRVCDLLGGALQEKIPIMWSLGGDTPEKNAEEALQRKHEGYTSTMIKVGGTDIVNDVKRVKAIREAVGKEYPLIVDANQGWDFHTAVRFSRRVEDCEIALLEQPVPYWDIEGLVKVKKSIDIPVSADESVFTIHDAKTLIEKNAVDVFSIKVVKHGGIFRSKEIMKLAEAYGIQCMMNSMIEEGISQAASLQLGASANNLWKAGHAYFSPLRLEEDITDYSSQIVNGWVNVPEKPGLGITIGEETLETYTVDTFEIY
ncbi:MAG: mandelate racemase [bacterium]|nr:mandelate racemase [bacterium]